MEECKNRDGCVAFTMQTVPFPFWNEKNKYIAILCVKTT